MSEVWQVIVGETLGTFILILLGNGIVANALLKHSRGNSGNWLAICIGWGFAVTIAAFLSSVSKAHLNPAVTIGLLAAGAKGAFVGSNFAYVPLYIIFQIIGAIIGQVFVYLAYYREYNNTDEKSKILATFATNPINRSYLWNTITEAIATFALVIVVIGTASLTRIVNTDIRKLGPIIVGIAVMVIGLALGGPTGFAINPARDLGPRIVHALLPMKNKGSSDWKYAFVPIVGPIIGGSIAGGFAQILNAVA